MNTTPTDCENLSALIICLLRSILSHSSKLAYNFSDKDITHFMPHWARTNVVLCGKYFAYLQKLTCQYAYIVCVRFFAMQNIFSPKTASHIQN